MISFSSGLYLIQDPDLFAILISNDGSLSGSCIGSKYDSVLEQTSYDGCTSAGRSGKWEASVEQEVVPGSLSV